MINNEQGKQKVVMSPEFKESIAQTLANEAWWKKNTMAVKEMLPQTWTNIANLNGLKLGFAMKILGINWRQDEEFGRVMVFFERIGLMERQHMFQVRANPHWEFNSAAILPD